MVVLEDIISEDIRYKLLFPLLLTGLAICTVFLFNRKLSTYLPSRLESRVLALGIVTISGYLMLKGWIEIEISSSSKEGEMIWRPVMYLFGIFFVSFSGSEFLRILLSNSDEIDEFETNILDWKNKSEIRKLLAVEQHVSEDLVVRYRIFHEAIKSVEQNNISFKDYPTIILNARGFERIDGIINQHAKKLHDILKKEFGWKDTSMDIFIEVYKRNFSDDFHERVASECLEYIHSEQALLQTEASLLKLAYYFSTYSNKNIDLLSNRSKGLIGNFIGDGSDSNENISIDFRKKLQIFWLFMSSFSTNSFENDQFVDSFFQNSVKNLEEAIKPLFTELEISHALKTRSNIFFNNSDSPSLDLNFIRGKDSDKLIQYTRNYLHHASLRKALMGQEFEYLGRVEYEDSKGKLVELLKKVLFGK